MVYKSGQIFLPFCHNTRVSDGRTDRRTEFLSLDRVCITCSVVKTRERICAHNGSKCVKSAKDVPFGGFVKKTVTLTLTSVQILKNFCITKADFRSKHVYILAEAPPKFVFVFEYETTHGISNCVKNLTGSRILTVSAHAQQKIG